MTNQSMETTSGGIGMTVLRIVLGAVFLYHGVDKFVGGIGQIAGMFGNFGIPLPTASAWIVALVESFGGIALILGLGARAAAGLLIPVMLVAIIAVHGPNGFSNINVVGMTEQGPQFGMPGWEYNLVLIGALAAVLLNGSGPLTVGGGGGDEL